MAARASSKTQNWSGLLRLLTVWQIESPDITIKKDLCTEVNSSLPMYKSTGPGKLIGHWFKDFVGMGRDRGRNHERKQQH